MLNRRTAGPVSSGDDNDSISAGEIELARVPSFRLGDLQVHPSTLQIEKNGLSKTAEPRVMQVLVVLAGSRGAVVSRDQLIERCWASRAVSEDAVNRCLAKVRRLGAESGDFEVETIPRVGFRLSESRPSEPADTPGWRGSRGLLLSAVLLVLLLGAGLFWRLQVSGLRTPPSIAVASFVALNADADAKPYADSVSTAVSDALVDTGARLAATEQPITNIDEARKAGAALLVRGTVRKQDDKIEVTATIESVRSASVLASKTFDAPLAEAAALPDRVAASLASILNWWISIAPTEPNADVSEQVLVTLTLLDDSPTRAISYARDLAEAHPNSAVAQASFAAATGFFLDNIPRDQRDKAAAEARRAAQEAGRMSPGWSFLEPCLLTPPGRLVLTAPCDHAVRQSIAADPDPSFANQFLSGALGQAGLFHEAARVGETSLAQSPYDDQRLIWRIFVLEMEHPGDQYNSLPALRQRALRFAPDLLKSDLMYEARLAHGDVDGAAALLNDPQTGARIDGIAGKQISADALRAMKTRSPADIAKMKQECLPPPPYWGPSGIAHSTCLVGLTVAGGLDSAFTFAQRYFADVECCTAAEREKAWLDGGGLYYPRLELWGPVMAPFRADPRFVEIARRTGLLAYWKSGHPPDFCSFERVPVCEVISRK